MKLFYGAYRIGDEKVLKVSDSYKCMSPNMIQDTFGMILAGKKIGISRQLARIAQMVEASAIEFITEDDFRLVEIR